METRTINVIKEHISSVLIPTLIASFFANWLLLTNGYGCPDTLGEGATYYQSANWALSLGRWAIRFINLGTLNIVMPLFNVSVSILCCYLVALMLAQQFSIKSRIFLTLTSIALAVSPAVVTQYLYIYMDLAYSLSLLFSTLSAYLILNAKKRIHYLLAILTLAFSLGAYQSYIGFTATIIMMSLIIKLISGETIRDCIRRGFYSVVCGLCGGILYLLILKGMQLAYNTPMSDYEGANKVSILHSLENLRESLTNMYKDFLSYVLDRTAYRNKSFVPLCLLGILIFILILATFINRRKFTTGLILSTLLITLPVCMNITTLIVPQRTTTLPMSHQMQLVIPFVFSLVDNICNPFFEAAKRKFLLTIFSSFFAAMVCWSCILSAYATHSSIVYIYHYMEHYSVSILSRIYESEEYDSNARILFAGIPNETEIQQSNPLYQYGYKWPAVFWNAEMGALNHWPRYLQYAYSIDIGYVSPEEYHKILQSDEFIDMQCFPHQNSIQMIDDILVVKIQDNPL